MLKDVREVVNEAFVKLQTGFAVLRVVPWLIALLSPIFIDISRTYCAEGRRWSRANILKFCPVDPVGLSIRLSVDFAVRGILMIQYG